MSQHATDLPEITIRRAKEIAVEKNGRLPKVGYEVKVYDRDGVTIWLQNYSGEYRLFSYFRPTYN